MTRTNFFLSILALIGLILPASAVWAAPEDQSPAVRSALRAARNYIKRFPERRPEFYPPGFTLPEVDDEVLIQYLKSDGTPTPTRLDPIQSVLINFGRSLQGFNDRGNLARLYKMLYRILPAEATEGRPKPKAIKKFKLPRLRRVYRKLLLDIDLHFLELINVLNPGVGGITPVNPIDDCTAEAGYEVAGAESESSTRCDLADYDPDGLFINVDFPLKDNLTCIKDQGRRGTCAAHAIAATVESLALLDGDPAENLSEQHIYYKGETEGDSQISVTDMQIEGLATTITLDAYDAQNIGIFYESEWNYNQSLGTHTLTFNPAQAVFTYPDSCSGYSGEECSDYSWQTISTVPLIALPSPGAPPAVSPSIHQIINNSYLGADPYFLTPIQLSVAVMLLAGDVPMIISMRVTSQFQNTTDGYVYQQANDPVLGGHAMELIGFVPNSEIPAGVTPATDQGFFIVKNSWGSDSGDCGFYYLDYAYVSQNIDYLSVITIS